MAYAAEHPFGYEIRNWRMGMLAATQVKLETGKSLKPSDFYPPSRKKRIQLSPRQEQQLKEKRKREKKAK